jgi:hypothetical protein
MRGYFVLAGIILITRSQAIGQRQMENLDRGVIVVRTGKKQILYS